MIPRLTGKLFLILVCGLFTFLPVNGSESERRYTVKGAGFFKDRLLMEQLRNLFQDSESLLDANDIEDAALIVVSEMQSDGYLEVVVHATLTAPDESTQEVEWDKNLEVYLPRETRARSVHFQINPGPRFYYHDLEIAGSQMLSRRDTEAFFFTEPYFFESESAKVFTPTLLTSGTQNLTAHLRTLGYQNASVSGEVIEQDLSTGATSVRVTINEGPIAILKEIDLNAPGLDLKVEDFPGYLGKPFSTFLRQDLIQAVRNRYYEAGYSRVSIDFKRETLPASQDTMDVRLEVDVQPGEQYRIASIEFQGNDTVRDALLHKQLTLEKGDFLNPAELAETRLNLTRLGLFHSVEYELKDLEDNQQALLFTLKELTQWEFDALIGWGSYERLRLGITAEKVNAFGRGHRLQFKSAVSTKSLHGETRYLIPRFLDSSFPLSTTLFYLEREEISFDREEFGIDLGTSRYLEKLDMHVDALYTFESLEARINDQGQASTAPENVRSGSVEFRFSRDKRDNPLNPESGYRFYGDFAWGSEALGGEVDYQAAEVGLSYHKAIKRDLLLHTSLSHAVVGSYYKSQSQIPTNKLLFPGGENSVRGYQRGEAAPRDAEQNFVGAQSYFLFNLELEQRLTKALSVVAFYDGLNVAADIDSYPFDQYLSSVGLGLRFRTFIGPIRLEYGHNLNQRPGDPDGTFHFTLGFPF